MNEKVRMRSHHFRKFGFEGKRGRARVEEGLVCHRKTQRAERVKTEEKGGTGGPETPRRQHPS